MGLFWSKEIDPFSPGANPGLFPDGTVSLGDKGCDGLVDIFVLNGGKPVE